MVLYIRFDHRYNQRLKKWTKNVKIFDKDFLIFPIIKESHWFLTIVCYPKSVYFAQKKIDPNLPELEEPVIKSDEPVAKEEDEKSTVNDEVKPDAEEDDDETEIEIEEVKPYTGQDDTPEVIVETPSVKEEKPSVKDVKPPVSEWPKPCIIWMDSLGDCHSAKKSLSSPIRDFLAAEWKACYGFEMSFKNRPITVCPSVLLKDLTPTVPKQNNSIDCGLFVLEYVEQFLKRPDELGNKWYIESKKTNCKDKFGKDKWFEPESVKGRRQEIRTLILDKVAECTPEKKERLETLIDDSKLSDDDDDEMKDEIGLRVDSDEDYNPDSQEL